MFIEILFKMLLSKGVYSFTLSTVYIINIIVTCFNNVSLYFYPGVHGIRQGGLNDSCAYIFVYIILYMYM